MPSARQRYARRWRRARGAFPERPCRNDLVNADFIDDGTRIRIVDWEFAGRTSLPSRLFPDIEEMDLSGGLGELMGGGSGLAPVRSIESVEAGEARRSDARILGVRRGSAMLIVERVGYSADGTAVSFGRDRFRGDRTRIVGSGAPVV